MNSCKCLIVLLTFFALDDVSGQILLQGRIMQSGTENPVPYASIGITNSFVGTASDEVGKFTLKVESTFKGERIVVSSLGYQNRSLSIDSLGRNAGTETIIYLDPLTLYLDEVVVNSKRPEPDELLREAIAAIPQNYSQRPFNLEFYSKMTVKDSPMTVKDSSKRVYEVESILLTYRKAYVSDAGNWSRILEKRVHGVSPLEPEYNKELKKKYFPYFPGFNISLVDQLGVGAGSHYTVFNPRKFAQMDFEYVGISVFDKDTVAVIEYALRKKHIKNPPEHVDGKYDGIIYVAINNLAIVRHTLKIGTTKLDIIYKKAGDNYFPYSIHTERPVYSGKKHYSLVHTVSLRRIEERNVEVIENDPAHWYPEDVEFHKQYWDANYPDNDFDSQR